jgi:rhodanese-related sulfurtransferase
VVNFYVSTTSHIPGAIQYNTSDKEIKKEDLNKTKIIVIYSQTSQKSSEIVRKLKSDGYRCFYLEGGWSEGWEPYLKDVCSTCGKSNIKERLLNFFK